MHYVDYLDTLNEQVELLYCQFKRASNELYIESTYFYSYPLSGYTAEVVYMKLELLLSLTCLYIHFKCFTVCKWGNCESRNAERNAERNMQSAHGLT